MHQLVPHHDAGENVAFTDEIGHEGVLGLVVNGFGGADLQNMAAAHHHDGIAHGEGLLLVVGDVEEGDAQALLHGFKLQLHFLAQL